MASSLNKNGPTGPIAGAMYGILVFISYILFVIPILSGVIAFFINGIVGRSNTAITGSGKAAIFTINFIAYPIILIIVRKWVNKLKPKPFTQAFTYTSSALVLLWLIVMWQAYRLFQTGT